MQSIAYDILEAVVARLRALPTLIAGDQQDRVRHTHRTSVPRDAAPAIRVYEALNEPAKAGGCSPRRFDFIVAIIMRDDAAHAPADALLLAVLQRLSPAAIGMPVYPHEARISAVRIRYEDETADADVRVVEIACTAQYDAGDDWSF